MSYTQHMLLGAGPGDCEEDVASERNCYDCIKKECKIETLQEDLEYCRYHMKQIMLHMYDYNSLDLIELEQSLQSLCYALDMEYDRKKTLKIQRKDLEQERILTQWTENAIRNVKGS